MGARGPKPRTREVARCIATQNVRIVRHGEHLCREYQGACVPGGYGEVRYGSEREYAHRLSWEKHNGRRVPKGRVVRHLCDNPPCTRGSHLILGTQRDNIHDMVRRGRQRTRPMPGEANGASKLRERDVLRIRELYAAGGWTYTALGRRFGVCYKTIKNIVTRRHWKHI